jgi:protein TonB
LNTASVWQNDGQKQERPSQKLAGPQKKALFAGAISCFLVAGLITTVILVRHYRAQAKVRTPAPIVTVEVPQPTLALPGRSELVSKAEPAKQPSPALQTNNLVPAQRELNQKQPASQPAKIDVPPPPKTINATPSPQNLPATSPVASKSQIGAPSPTPSLLASNDNVVSSSASPPIAAPTPTPTLASAVVPVPSRPTPTTADPPLPTRDEFVPAQLVKKTTPKFPQNASNRSFSIGVVTLRVSVGRDGKVSNSKYVSGNLFFSDAAMACVKQWEYAPAMRNGQPVESQQIIILTFGHE